MSRRHISSWLAEETACGSGGWQRADFNNILSGFVPGTKPDSFSFGDWDRASPESSGLSGEQADGPSQCQESSQDDDRRAPQGV